MGSMYGGRWRHILETYGELGMLDGPVDLEGFLYDASPEKDYTRLAWMTGGALVGWARESCCRCGDSTADCVSKLPRRWEAESVVGEGSRFVAELPLCEAPSAKPLTTVSGASDPAHR